MRKKLFYVLIILIFMPVIGYGLYLAKTKPIASPDAFIHEETYAFPPVMAGEEVRHDFVLRNKGSSPLDILEVKADCGCTTASYSKQIAAGSEGKITIQLDTRGYGGQHITKSMVVRTNDKKKSEFDLVLVGDIKPVADINPTEATLTGNVGQKIKQTVMIVPTSENRFKIVEVKAEKGDNIHYDLIEINQPDGIKYQLTIYNMKKEKGWYIDNIYLKTSSTISPVLKVRVLGFIRNRL
jgi:hypothetical protein